MSKVQHLLEQAARAERLARSVLDAVTIDRLQAFAAECRTQAKTSNEQPPVVVRSYDRTADVPSTAVLENAPALVP
jgi:hypothetical protein